MCAGKLSKLSWLLGKMEGSFYPQATSVVGIPRLRIYSRLVQGSERIWRLSAGYGPYPG